MELLWTLQLALVLLLPSAIYVYRHRGDWERAVKGAGLTLAVTYTLVFSFFIGGETALEVGGWQAAGLISIWLLPLVGLILLAWYRPELATYILAGLLLIAAAVYLWSAFDIARWRGFEDVQGPVRGIISFSLVAPIALLGWKRPAVGGTMLLVLAALPVFVVLADVITAGAPAGWPLMIVSAPAALVGVLYLISTTFSTGRQISQKPEMPAAT